MCKRGSTSDCVAILGCDSGKECSTSRGRKVDFKQVRGRHFLYQTSEIVSCPFVVSRAKSASFALMLSANTRMPLEPSMKEVWVILPEPVRASELSAVSPLFQQGAVLRVLIAGQEKGRGIVRQWTSRDVAGEQIAARARGHDTEPGIGT